MLTTVPDTLMCVNPGEKQTCEQDWNTLALTDVNTRLQTVRTPLSTKFNEAITKLLDS